MPQQPINKEYSSFVKGIITEASPLTFPQNATIDEENFVLNRDGSRQRRLGMDYEEGFSLVDSLFARPLFEVVGLSTHSWININEDTSLSFFIIQIGNLLWFFDALKESVSGSIKNRGLPLGLPGAGFTRWQSDNLGGRIVFATGEPSIFSLVYDASTDTVDFTTHGLLTRDVWGLDDALDTDQRPLVLDELHKYNLINQGWGAVDPDSPVPTKRVYYEEFKTFSIGGKYPSNADLVQAGISATDNKFNTTFVERSFLGNSPSPKGHHIIDVFNRGESRAFAQTNTSLLNNGGLNTGFWTIPGVGSFPSNFGSFENLKGAVNFPLIPVAPGIPVDNTANTGMRVIASYAERFFYAGSDSLVTGGDSKSPLLSHLIFFSQLIDAIDKVGKCYQEADPTSDEQADLVATDGGFIKIPGMSRCLKMVPYSNSLIVFAENGIWEVRGGEDGNFKATDFQVLKITDTGAINEASIVEVEDRIYYWSTGGIYALTRDQISLGVLITSISETTIQTLVETFPALATENVVGAYDPVTKQVRWMVNDQLAVDYDGILEVNRYNVELVHDVVLEAFYKVRLPDTTDTVPYIAGYVVSPGQLTVESLDNIVVGVDNVKILSTGDNVVITTNIRKGDFFKLKYLTVKPKADTITPFDFTFSFFKEPQFKDWDTHFALNGLDAKAFMLTGQETLQDTQRKKQAVYFTAHFLRTETGFELNAGGDLEASDPSSCLVQSQWDFADSVASGKFGPKFQAYRLQRNFLPSGLADQFDFGHQVITTKSKLRGRGRALSILFETEPKKDLIILGWGLIFGVNTNV